MKKEFTVRLVELKRYENGEAYGGDVIVSVLYDVADFYHKS